MFLLEILAKGRVRILTLPKIVAVGIYNANLVHRNAAVTKNRKTTMFELELATANGGTSYIDDESRPITENLVIAAKPGQFRHTRLPFTCYFVHMIVEEGEIYDLLSTLPNYLEIADASEIREIFTEMCTHYGTGAASDEIMLQSLLLKLVYTFGKYAPYIKINHSPKRNNHTVIDHTLKYINENLTADLTLDTLSKEAKFSPIYFHKLFLASTGKRLREYVEEQRIKKAVELLVSSDKTLSEIAYECGFSSQAYFSTAFKRIKKETPRDYAKKLLMEYEK